MGLSILTSVDQKSLEPEFLQLKTKFWSDYKKDLRIFWESAHALIDFLEKYESQIPQKSDLHLKFKRVHHELYEAVHEYNLEVLLIENRLQKRFFRLINTLFLNIDSNQLHHLHEY